MVRLLVGGRRLGRRAAIMMMGSVHDLERNGARLVYDDLGTGPAVLFSHSWFCDASQWPQAPAIARAGYRALVLDNRGHGRSGAHLNRYTIWDMADDLLAVLDDAGEKSAVIVGLSIGGFAALRLALRHPNRVRALVLADTGAGRQDWLGRFKGRVLSPVYLSPARKLVVPQLLKTLFGPTARRMQPDLVAQWRTRFLAQNARSMATALRAVVTRDDLTDRLVQIHVPTLVVVGEEDENPGMGAAEALVAGIPGARLTVLPKTGHLSALEAPERFEELLLEFLDDLDNNDSRRRGQPQPRSHRSPAPIGRPAAGTGS